MDQRNDSKLPGLDRAYVVAILGSIHLAMHRGISMGLGLANIPK